MLAALTFDDILQRAPAWGTSEDPLGQRLVSVIFASPSSPVWRDLATNRAFLDTRSGESWDLFFAGMSAYAPIETDAVPIDGAASRRTPQRFMNSRAFACIEQAVYRGQRQVGCGPDERWSYSGQTDLVSFMCYARQPDWASLRNIQIEESMTGRPMSLGRITEGLTRWAVDDADPDLAPGSDARLQDGRNATSLVEALSWSATAIVGGVLGDAAYDLLKVLLEK